MTADEVAALSDTIDLQALRDYRDAVGRRTRETVRSMPEAAWEGRLGAEDLKRETEAGAFGRAAASLERFFTGLPPPGRPRRHHRDPLRPAPG